MAADKPTRRDEKAPYRVRLPAFIVNEEIGLGDVVSRAASYVGIKPCGGCRGRSETLNSRLAFSPWRWK